jgi:hypothetical protein
MDFAGAGELLLVILIVLLDLLVTNDDLGFDFVINELHPLEFPFDVLLVLFVGEPTALETCQEFFLAYGILSFQSFDGPVHFFRGHLNSEFLGFRLRKPLIDEHIQDLPACQKILLLVFILQICRINTRYFLQLCVELVESNNIIVDDGYDPVTSFPCRYVCRPEQEKE